MNLTLKHPQCNITPNWCITVKNQKGSLIFLESTEVAEVVGVSPIQLNKLVEREQYGVAPSIRSGKGRGSRRLFSEGDVYGVALVWWLFEAGLRSEAIRDVLKHIARAGRKDIASDAALVVLLGKFEMIVIRREPRSAGNARRSHPTQEVLLVDWTAATHLVEETVTASVLFIPIAERFSKLKEAMQKIGLTVGKG
jgi:hypothetical protein